MDDQEPTFTSMPALATLSGNTITGFSMLPGIDPRKYASSGIYNQSFTVLAADGTMKRVQMQGIHPVVTALGGEFHNEFGAFAITDKLRWTEMSGSFSNQWTGEMATSALAGTGTLRYAAGPQAGQVYTGAFVSKGAQAYTTMNDMGSLANDLTLNGKFIWAARRASTPARAGSTCARPSPPTGA
jgi:hypothetical protein